MNKVEADDLELLKGAIDELELQERELQERQERYELGLQESDELNFQKRVVNLLMGETHPKLFGETPKEQARNVLVEIRQQLIDRKLSVLAMGYLEDCLSLHVDRGMSLDDAFYPAKKTTSGGQERSLQVKRAVVAAFLKVINRDVKKEWLVEERMYIYKDAEIKPETKRETKREAKRAALEAYRKAGGGHKNLEGNYKDDEAAIEKTIMPILKEHSEAKFLV